MIPLRDYQEDACHAALEALDRGERALIEAPTGSGKSVMLAEIARHQALGPDQVAA